MQDHESLKLLKLYLIFDKIFDIEINLSQHDIKFVTFRQIYDSNDLKIFTKSLLKTLNLVSIISITYAC